MQEADRIAKKTMACRLSSGEFLCGIAPPQITDTSKALKVSEMLKYFKSDGSPAGDLTEFDSSGCKFIFNSNFKAHSNISFFSIQGMQLN